MLCLYAIWTLFLQINLMRLLRDPMNVIGPLIKWCPNAPLFTFVQVSNCLSIQLKFRLKISIRF